MLYAIRIYDSFVREFQYNISIRENSLEYVYVYAINIFVESERKESNFYQLILHAVKSAVALIYYYQL